MLSHPRAALFVPRPRMRLPDRHKYATHALRTGMSGLHLNEVVDLGDGLIATRDAPVGLPDHWKEWLGSFEERELAEADLFLTATAPSTHLDILDRENQALRRRVQHVYAGLLLATPGIRIVGGRALSGAVRAGEADLRETQRLDLVYAVVGASKMSVIGSYHLSDAVAVGRGLAEVQRLEGTPGFGDGGRLKRALNALYACLHSRHLDFRLHQAVRVLEALMSSGEENFRDVMKRRAPRLLGDVPGISELPDTLYKLRNKVEHMYGPVRAVRLAKLVEPDVADGAALAVFARATHVAEFLAQSLLTRVLSNAALWPFFTSDGSIPDFWDSAASVDLWGQPVGVSLKEFMRTFDERSVLDAFEEVGEDATDAEA